MDFNLALDYKFRETDTIDNFEELTANYILGCLNVVYKDGVEGQKRRIISRIQRKLDEALDEKKQTVVFEQAEFDLVSESIEKAKMPPIISKYLVVIEDEVERLKLAKKAESKA